MLEKTLLELLQKDISEVPKLKVLPSKHVENIQTSLNASALGIIHTTYSSIQHYNQNMELMTTTHMEV